MTQGSILPVDPINQPRHREGPRLSQVRICIVAAMVMLIAGCGKLSDESKPAKADPTAPGRQAGEGSAKPIADTTAGSLTNRASFNADDLSGKSATEVAALLGKPQGKIQTKAGTLWLYANWRVQFDAQEQVLGVEKDFPIPMAALDPKHFGPRTSPGAASSGRAPASPGKVNVVSNGGQEVDLLALMPHGRITVVDFYADWCGPCRQISPYLERLAAQDPEVALVKVNIVDWQTPVTRQFDIRSVPSIRVFDKRKAQVGSATHDLNLVFDYIKQAR